MRITATRLNGAFFVELERKTDNRGFFARSWCREEFRAHGLETDISQCNVGFSHRAGTLRGIHLQVPPHEEIKLVRCVRGMIYDVIVDLRPDSATFCQWISAQLTADNHLMLYIPQGFGHGYQTLTDNAEIVYQTSESYHPESSTGIRYNDPAFGFRWPLPVRSISPHDERWPDFDVAVARAMNVTAPGGAL